MIKKIHPLLVLSVFFSVLAIASASAKINAHFILLAKHSKYENPFILLERREHLWALPNVEAEADELKTDAGILKNAALVSFNMVPIDPQRTAKFDNHGKEMVFAAMSGREVNPLLLEHELNRLNALNPDVRELRWIEYTTAAFANDNSIFNGQCLGIDDQLVSCKLALSSFATKVLFDNNVRTNISALLHNIYAFKDVKINVIKDVELSVIPQHFMIAARYEKCRYFWYFVEQNGSYTLPMFADVKSSKDYLAKVKQHYQLDFKSSGNLYTEISNLHQDAKTGQYYLDIFHVHSAKFKATTPLTGSLWCNPDSVARACGNPSLPVNCLYENDYPHDQVVAFDRDRLCPLFTNALSRHRIHFPDGFRTVGTFLVRTVSGKHYALFMARDNADGGWTVPGGKAVFPQDYCTNHDPLLVAALRNLKEKTHGAIKLDIDQVEKSCTTISKNDEHGNISRFQICRVDNNFAFSSAEILKKAPSFKDRKYSEWAGNVRWICLDDILKAAKVWKAPSPFMVNADTLGDDDSYFYSSSYRLYHQIIDIILQEDFSNSLQHAISKDNSFNSAFIKKDFILNQSAYAGALLLDSATKRIGFAKADQTGIPYIPLSGVLYQDSYTWFTIEGISLCAKVFSEDLWKLNNHSYPIINFDTLVNDIGVSKNIVLFEKSVITGNATNIEWIRIDAIATHPNLSDEDKANFAEASCLESLKYWIAFYMSKVDSTVISLPSTTSLVLVGNALPQNPAGSASAVNVSLPQNSTNTALQNPTVSASGSTQSVSLPQNSTKSLPVISNNTTATTNSSTNATTTTACSAITTTTTASTNATTTTTTASNTATTTTTNATTASILTKSNSTTNSTHINIAESLQKPVSNPTGNVPSKSYPIIKFKPPNSPRGSCQSCTLPMSGKETSASCPTIDYRPPSSPRVRQSSQENKQESRSSLLEPLNPTIKPNSSTERALFNTSNDSTTYFAVSAIIVAILGTRSLIRQIYRKKE